MNISDAQLRRWKRYRAGLHFDKRGESIFATGGLGHFVPELKVRMLILPADVDTVVLPTFSEAKDWFMQLPSSLVFPGGNPRWGVQSRSTSEAYSQVPIPHIRLVPEPVISGVALASG